MNPEQALLSTLDYAIFFGSLILVMIIGLWAGRKEDTAEDFIWQEKEPAGGAWQVPSSVPTCQPTTS